MVPKRLLIIFFTDSDQKSNIQKDEILTLDSVCSIIGKKIYCAGATVFAESCISFLTFQIREKLIKVKRQHSFLTVQFRTFKIKTHDNACIISVDRVIVDEFIGKITFSVQIFFCNAYRGSEQSIAIGLYSLSKTEKNLLLIQRKCLSLVENFDWGMRVNLPGSFRKS